MKKSKKKRKPGSGRRPTIFAKPVRLTLDAETIRKGQVIGKGNLSAGVRTAVEQFIPPVTPLLP